MVPDEVLRANAGTATRQGKIALVPLANLACSKEIDQFLQTVVTAGRKNVHEAIDNILEVWPGRNRAELWTLLRKLRTHQGKTGNGRIDWDQEDLEILRTLYGQGRAGAREAIKRIRARRPGRSARSIWHKAARLGVSNGSGRPKPWSREEQGILLWNVGEKPVEKIARKLGRTVKAVRQMMSSRGLSSKVRIPKDYSLHRVAKLLGVSDSGVRVWFRKGLFGGSANPGRQQNGSGSGPRVSAAELVAFCRKYPDKVNTRQCHPDLWLVVGDESVPPNVWHGPRQHLTKKRQCPRCQRVVRGNAYFRHVKRCIGRGTSARGTETRTTTG
jgi:hypothetical protein